MIQQKLDSELRHMKESNFKQNQQNYFKISQNLIKMKVQHNWLVNYKLHVNTKFSKYLICIDNNLKVEKN